MKLFRYQAVFSESGQPFVAFTGVTEDSPEDQLITLRSHLKAANLECELVSFSYEPYKNDLKCQEEEGQKATSE